MTKRPLTRNIINNPEYINEDNPTLKVMTARQSKKDSPHGGNAALIKSMREGGVLKSPHIIEAFERVKRIDFVPENFRDNAYLDIPIPLAEGMTTSQPSTIAFMLEKLQPGVGDRILEIGTGSGYQTALLAEITGESGAVHSIEIMPELNKFAENNLKKYKYKNITLYLKDGKKGVPEKAPFNKIISGAETAAIPNAWKKQLTIGGLIVTPFDHHVLKAVKISESKFKETKFPYFRFVKLA